MARMTVTTIRETAKQKFDDLELELEDGSVVVFQHLLRLSDTDRAKILDKLQSFQEKLKDEDDKDTDDSVGFLQSVLRDILKGVSSDKAKADKLLKSLGLPELNVVFQAWQEETKPGEASSSES